MKVNKFLFFDLDGTLLNKEHTINTSTVDAIKKVRQNGNRVSIATGRSLPLAIEFISEISADDYVIISNGCLLYDTKNKKIIEASNPLSNELKTDFFKIIEKYSCSFLSYSLDANYFFAFDEESKKAFEPYLENSIDLTPMGFEKAKEFLFKTPIYNFSEHSSIISHSEFLDIFRYAKDEKKWCNMTSALNGFVDIYGYGVSKLTAFKKVSELLNLNINDVYYFGDSMNDYDMVCYVKNSIAMGNAINELKQKAKYVIGNHDTDAIAEFLNQELF